MQKVIGFIRRRPDHDFARFSCHWKNVHRAEAMKLRPWLKGYEQNHLLPGPLADIQRPADGCPILWVESAESIAEMAASPEFRTGAYLDEPRFMEGRSSGLAVWEETLLAGSGPIKLMLFCGLAKGHQPAGIWPTAHACGHVRNHAFPGQSLDPGFAFDFVDEICWPDAESYDADRQAARPPADMPGIDPHRLKAALAEVLVVFKWDGKF